MSALISRKKVKLISQIKKKFSPRTNQMPPQNQQRPQPGVMYDNPEYMNRLFHEFLKVLIGMYIDFTKVFIIIFFCSTMPRMPPGGNPYDSQQQQGYTIVEDPRAGYFSTATLPSNAALRKPSGPGYVLIIHLFSIFHISN